MRLAAVAAVAAAALAGCGKPDAPTADAAAERAAATERAKKDVFGTQVKAVENAKGLGADLERKAQAGVDKADAMGK